MSAWVIPIPFQTILPRSFLYANTTTITNSTNPNTGGVGVEAWGVSLQGANLGGGGGGCFIGTIFR